jgi:protein-S-isoprenylcysteine O-methyltransferase Ste14
VALQVALMGAVVAAGLLGPGWSESASVQVALAGAALAVAGAVVAGVAARALGRGLTPFPRPPGSVTIVERGPYGLVRHPMYAAGSLFFAGYSLALSPAALAFTAALVVLWGLKARVEERFLLAAEPEYAGYRERVRYRLVPFVY